MSHQYHHRQPTTTLRLIEAPHGEKDIDVIAGALFFNLALANYLHYRQSGRTSFLRRSVNLYATATTVTELSTSDYAFQLSVLVANNVAQIEHDEYSEYDRAASRVRDQCLALDYLEQTPGLTSIDGDLLCNGGSESCFDCLRLNAAFLLQPQEETTNDREHSH